MIRRFSAVFLIAAAIAGAQTKPAAAPRRPAATPSVKVGVVDVRGALFATSEGKKALAKISADMEGKKQDLAKRKSAIEDLQLRLSLNDKNLSDDQKAELTRQIEQQTRDQNRLVDDVEAEIRQEEDQVIGQLGQKLVAVVRQYGQANGYTIIVSANQPLLFSVKSQDITAEIVKLYEQGAASAPAPKK